jgi:hypothetical protein
MIGYISIIALPIIFLLLLKEPKYRNLLWIKIFVIERIVYLLIYDLPYLYTIVNYARLRFIFYLLLVAVIEEIVRKELGKKTWWWAVPAVLIVIGSMFFITYGFPNFYIPRIIPFVAAASLLHWSIKNKYSLLFGFSFMGSTWLISDVFKLFKSMPAISLSQKILDIWIEPLSYLIILSGLLYLLFDRYVHLSIGLKPQTAEATAGDSKVIDFPNAFASQSSAAVLSDTEIEHQVNNRLEEFEHLMQAAAIAAEIHNKTVLGMTDLMVLLDANQQEVEEFLAKNDIPKLEITKGKWVVFKKAVYLKLGLIED